MNVLSFIAFTVYAAETVVSPLPDLPVGGLPSRPTATFADIISPLPASGQVLGATAPTPTATPMPSPTVAPIKEITPTPTPANVSKKKNIVIAVLGDSMVDTLGPDVPHLKAKLSSLFSSVNFTVLNYGVGGTNIDYGLERTTSDYTYLNKHIPSLVSQRPDVVVVESFGYNPYPQPEGAIDRHWLALAKIVDMIKIQLPATKIVIAATIAPNAKVFCDGAAGISFSVEDKWKRVDVIKKYLESTVAFAKSQHLPLADAYHPSLQPDGNGNLAYINAGDHIHPSDSGRELFAQKVTEAITTNHLLE